MKPATQLAKQFRDVYFGGNWTATDLKTVLADVTLQEANTKVDSLNTVAMLVYHINYYVIAVTKVLEGGPLDAHDKFSFDLPPINNQQDWEELVNKTFSDAEKFAALVEQLPDDKLWGNFGDGKYGTYYRNISGIIEHNHYHLGQIVLIKKLLKKAQSILP